jgi:hypothetical protein
MLPNCPAAIAKVRLPVSFRHLIDFQRDAWPWSSGKLVCEGPARGRHQSGGRLQYDTFAEVAGLRAACASE